MPGMIYRCWRLNGFGLDRLALAEIDARELGNHDLLVRVRAVSLNHRDHLILEGLLAPELAFPYTPASDMAGEIVAVGAGVRRFRIGDRVVGHAVTDWIDGQGPAVLHQSLLSGALPGVLGEYVILGEDAAVAVPPTLTDQEAATLPIAGLTAWSALVEVGQVVRGQTILIQGTGGVALFALQFAALFGLRPIVTSSSDAKLARASALGAWRTVNYRTTPDWDDAVIDMTGGAGVDHVLELAGGEGLRRSINALAIGGRLLLIGILAGTESVLPTVMITRKRITLHGIAVGHRRAFERMIDVVAGQSVRPVIEANYPFDDAPAAFAHLAQGPLGKIVISVS